MGSSMARSAIGLALFFAARVAAEPPPNAAPVVIDGTLTTLLAGHQDPRDGKIYTVVPVYQSLALSVDGMRLGHFAQLRLVVSGWGEVAFGEGGADLAAPTTHNPLATGDLDAAFLEAVALDGRLQLRLGRQLLFAGAARALQLDGASTTVRLWRGLGLEAYGGVPVTPRFVVHQGDAAAGGRVFFRHSYDSEVGLSFIEVLDQGRVARQDLGADARVRPLRSLTLSGYALLSLVELRLAEGDAAVTWQPLAMLQVRADYRRTAPDLFLPRSSILSVFASESHDEVGGDLYLRPLSRLRLSADYHTVLDDGGIGHRGGAKLTVSLGRAQGTQVGTELRVLHLFDQGYVQSRLFGIHRLLPTLVLTLDLDAYHLEQAVNGQTFSLTGAATLGWDFHPGWRAVVTGIGDVTPYVERRFEGMVKLVYNHVFRVRQVAP
jgi:hypothetical protein